MLKTTLCVQKVKCVKNSEYVIHIWITGGGEQPIIFIQFFKCCHSCYLCGNMCPTALPPSRRQKMMLTDILHCRFVHRHAIKIRMTYSESSWPNGSNNARFSYLSLSWVSNRCLKTLNDSRGAFHCQKQAETDRLVLFWLKWQLFVSGYAQRAKTGMVWTAWSWGFQILDQNCSTLSVNERQSKKSEHFIKSLCE